jgi:WD40 repeat protein
VLLAPRPAAALAVASSIVFVTLALGNPHAAPNAGKVVFEARGSILAVNPDGTRLRVLAESGSDPSVSRDGTQIAFDSYSDGDDHVFVMRADGTGQRQVGSAAGHVPVWSPDGTRIAYSGPSFSGDLYVVNADGRGDRRVAADADKFGIAWSPDGQQIAYSAPDGIALVRVDSGERRVLAGTAEGAWRPAWSPDGRRIAFLSDSNDVVVADVDGSGSRKLANAGTPPTPAWSPDGKRILFVRRGQIYAINTDGRGERRLTRSAWGELFDAPAWSPDGSRIVFLRGRFPDECCENDVWTMNADGSDTRVLVKPVAQDGLNDWSAVWAPGSVAGPGRRVPRFVTARPSRRLSGLAPVSSGLAADGPLAAAAVGCAVAMWDARAGRLERSDALCPDDGGVKPAVAGKLGAWILDEPGGTSSSPQQSTLFVKRPGSQPRQEAVAFYYGLFRGNYLDNLVGDGSLLVFNTWHQKQSEVTRARLWRVDARRKTAVRSEADALPVVAVDDDRIATLGEDGKLTLLNAAGRRLRTLSLGRDVDAVRLDGSRLVVLRGAVLDVRDAGSARLLRRRPLQLGVSGKVQLEDVDSGLVVYVAGLAIHVLRLSDGRDVTLRLVDEGSEAHAQLEPEGLFYAYNQAWTTTPGRLGFVPMQELERRLRAGH